MSDSAAMPGSPARREEEPTRVHPLPPPSDRARRTREEVRSWLHHELHRQASLGHSVRVEAFRNLIPTDELTARDWIELIELEQFIRSQRGERLAISEYFRRFPDLREALAEWQAERDPSVAVNSATMTRFLPESAGSGSSRVDLQRASGSAGVPTSLSIPGYEICEVLGRGGMGIVYKAIQKGLNRTVALKMILNSAHADEVDRRRFQQEAESVARLRHTHIVQVYDIGEHEGHPFIALEYVAGGTLHQNLQRRAVPEALAVRLLIQLADAIDHAHAHGIIHRDLKPANILLEGEGLLSPPLGGPGSDGRLTLPLAKVTDFGLAKRMDSERDLTVTGLVAGTPHYMAPEQIRGVTGRKVGPEADVYALGAILYEMLAGRRAFESSHPLEVLNMVLMTSPAPLRRHNPRVARDLETICMKCLEKDPARRYRTAHALAEDLRRFAEGEPILARPISPVGVGVRWCRRNPFLAGLLFVTVASVAVAFFSILVARQAAEEGAEVARREATAARSGREAAEMEKLRANSLAEDALRLRTEAEEASRRSAERERSRRQELYATRMVQVANGIEQGNLRRARQYLEEYEPVTPDAPDYRGFEWYFLRAQCYEPRQAFRVPGGSRSVAVSPDGQRVLWGFANTATEFDLARREQTAEYADRPDRKMPAAELPERGTRVVAYSPDGKLVAASIPSRPLQVWERVGGTLRYRVERQPIGAMSMAISPGSRHVAIGYGDDWNPGAAAHVEIHSLAPNGLLHRLEGHESPVAAVAFDAGGQQLASVTRAGRVRIWGVADGKLIRQFDTPSLAICAAWRPTRPELAVGHVNGQVTVHHPDTGEELRRFAAHADAVEAIAYHPTSNTLATGGRDTLVKLWVGSTAELIRSFRGHLDAVRGLAFDPAQPHIYSAGDDGQVYGWQLGIDPSRVRLDLVAPSLGAMQLSPAGDRLLALTPDHRVATWPVQPLGSRTPEVAGPAAAGAPLVRAIPDPARQRSLVLFLPGDRIWVWPSSGDPPRPLESPGPLPGIVSLAISDDGRRLATLHANHEVQLHRLDAPGEPLRFKAELPHGHAICFDPAASRLLIGSQDGVIRGYDAASGAPRDAWAGHEGGVTSLFVEVGGRRLVSLGVDGRAILWDLSSGRKLRVIAPLSGAVNTAAFLPGGKRLVTGGADGRLRIWDLDNGEELLVVAGHSLGVQQILPMPSGDRIFSLGRDGRIFLWRAPTLPDRERARRFALEAPPNDVRPNPYYPDGVHLDVGGRHLGSTRIEPWTPKSEQPRTLRFTLEVYAPDAPADARPLSVLRHEMAPSATAMNPGDTWAITLQSPLPPLPAGDYRVRLRRTWATADRTAELPPLELPLTLPAPPAPGAPALPAGARPPKMQ